MFSKSRLAIVLLGITLISTAAFAGETNDSRAFLKKAARDGMAEVQFAQLALQMASNPEIQSFAKHMIEDHAAANDRLAALAKTGKVTLHKEISPKRKSLHKKFSKLNDRNRSFDRAYIDQAVKDHEKAVAAYEKQAAHGTDADVRAFAAETLPKLKKHLDMATALSTKLGAKNQEN